MSIAASIKKAASIPADIFFVITAAPSPNESLDDSVVRDGLADHWSRILRL